MRAELPLILLKKIDERLQSSKIKLRDVQDSQWRSMFEPDALVKGFHPTPMSPRDCTRAFAILNRRRSVTTRLLPMFEFPSTDILVDYDVVCYTGGDCMICTEKHMRVRKCVCPQSTYEDGDRNVAEIDVMKHALLEVLRGMEEIPWAHSDGWGCSYLSSSSRSDGKPFEASIPSAYTCPRDECRDNSYATHVAYVEVSFDNVKRFVMAVIQCSLLVPFLWW